MFLDIYTRLGITSQTALVVISLSLMLIVGFLLTRITKLLRLPNVTAYLIGGILIGPYCFNLIPEFVVKGTDFLNDVALALIAFSAGEYFSKESLKKNGLKVTIISLIDCVITTLIVFVTLYFIIKMNIYFSLILSALSSCVSVTSTTMIIRQTGSKGEFVDVTLQTIGFEDVIAIIAFSICLGVSISQISASSSGSSTFVTILVNLGMIGLGALFGFIMKLALPKRRTIDNRLIIALALIFSFCGICMLVSVSPLLGCMMMGAMFINVSSDDKLFKQLNYFMPPILLLFFVRSGVNFKLTALFSGGIYGSVPLIVVALVYILVRTIGKILGTFTGAVASKSSKTIRNYLGLALLPHGGVTIGLAALAARTFAECGLIAQGEAIETIILTAVMIYELIGPACAKLALSLSKSYSESLDDQSDVSVDNEKKRGLSDAEILVEQIKDIRSKLPKIEASISEEEDAFSEAADEFYDYRPYDKKGRRFRR